MYGKLGRHHTVVNVVIAEALPIPWKTKGKKGENPLLRAMVKTQACNCFRMITGELRIKHDVKPEQVLWPCTYSGAAKGDGESTDVKKDVTKSWHQAKVCFPPHKIMHPTFPPVCSTWMWSQGLIKGLRIGEVTVRRRLSRSDAAAGFWLVVYLLLITGAVTCFGTSHEHLAPLSPDTKALKSPRPRLDLRTKKTMASSLCSCCACWLKR